MRGLDDTGADGPVVYQVLATYRRCEIDKGAWLLHFIRTRGIVQHARVKLLGRV